jgi:hypothetical protein
MGAFEVPEELVPDSESGLEGGSMPREGSLPHNEQTRSPDSPR